MSQDNRARPAIDLDELERQLKQVVPVRRPAVNDPLAELARIVGQDNPLRPVTAKTRARPSQPQPSAASDVAMLEGLRTSLGQDASGKAAAFTPQVAPLFDEAARPGRVDAAPPNEPAPIAEPAESAAWTESAASAGSDNWPAFTDETARAIGDAAMNAVRETQSFEQAMSAHDANHTRGQHEQAVFVPVPTDLTYLISAPDRSAASPVQRRVSERHDHAFEGLPPDTSMQGDASFAIAVPPPPDELDVVQPRRARRRGLVAAGIVLGIGIIGVGALMARVSSQSSAVATPGVVPLITAKPGPIKERPDNPGGIVVPNQDRQIFSRPVNDAGAPVQVTPREEQPVDLAQAQRREPRQIIPGMATSSPPVGSSPAPGVVIPPAADVPPPGRVAAADPVGLPPLLSQPVPPSAPVVSSASPLPPSVFAPAVPQTQGTPPGQLGEPRRVRANVIRADETDTRSVAARPTPPAAVAAPPRPRPQSSTPPVQPIRPAAEADDVGGPLRLTPAPRNQQRIASATPSTSALAAPPVSAPASAADAPQASGGGGFAVQLTAEGSEAAARTEAQRLASRFSDALGGQQPGIRRAEVNGSTVYRVRVGSMSREEAVSVCEKLRAAGGKCFVARN